MVREFMKSRTRADSKFEYRNPKSETNPNEENSKLEAGAVSVFAAFAYSDFPLKRPLFHRPLPLLADLAQARFGIHQYRVAHHRQHREIVDVIRVGEAVGLVHALEIGHLAETSDLCLLDAIG